MAVSKKLNPDLLGHKLYIQDWEQSMPSGITIDGVVYASASLLWPVITAWDREELCASRVVINPDEKTAFLPFKSSTYDSEDNFAEFVWEEGNFNSRYIRIYSEDGTAANAHWENSITNNRGYMQMRDDGTAKMPIRITEATDAGSDYKYLILAHADAALNASNCVGMIHVTGTLGGFGSQRKADFWFDCRSGGWNETIGDVGYNTGNDKCGLELCADDYSDDEDNQGYYGNAYLILWARNWYCFDLYIDGRQITFLPEGQTWYTNAQIKNKISGYRWGGGYSVCTSEKTNQKGQISVAD